MIRLFLFIVLGLIPGAAFAGPRCANFFLDSSALVSSAYVSLDSSLPGRTVEDEHRLRRLGPDGVLMGEMEFDIRRIGGRPVLEVERIVISPAYRRLGLSKLLLATLLKDYPLISEIRSHGLALDNVAAFRAARLRGLSLREAITATPAYRVRASLGFPQIDDAQSLFLDGADPKLNLVVHRR